MDLLTKDSLRILLVEEDDDANAHATDLWLHSVGFTQPLVRLSSGTETQAYLTNLEPTSFPHVILLDLPKQGLMGLDVVRWLRSNHQDKKVFVYTLTSSKKPEDIHDARLAGGTQYISKMTLYSDLSQALDEVIYIHNHRALESLGNLRGVKSELMLMGLFSKDMIVLTDSQGYVEWVNGSFVQACGYTLDEVRGKKPGALLQGPQSDPMLVKALSQAVRSASPLECELINYRKNGTPYHVHISLGPLFHEGILDGFLAVEQLVSKDI